MTEATRVASAMRTLLFQQTNVVISWDDHGWLYVDWIGMQSLSDLKAGSDQLVRLLQSKSADSVLNDNTRADGIASEAAEWLGRDWFPRMRRTGLQRFAWVRSPTGLTDVVAVSGGSRCALALHSDGTVTAWGASDAVVHVPAELRAQ